MPKISKYAAVTAPADSDVFVVVQGGVTKKISYAQIKAGVVVDADTMVYKGAIACAGNPNYPAADAGHVYKVSSAGRIGGASGPVVAIGDMLICAVDGTASGTHAAVGANWNIFQGNMDLESATAENDMLFGGPSPFGWIRKTLAQGLAILMSTATGTGVPVLATSPTLAGTPLAPTAAAATNTTQIATTAFVQAAATAVGVATVGGVDCDNMIEDLSCLPTVLFTWDPGSLADGVGETSSSVAVPGATLGNTVAFAVAPYDLQGITCNAYVDAANSVKVRLQNETTGTIDLASGSWAIECRRL